MKVIQNQAKDTALNPSSHAQKNVSVQDLNKSTEKFRFVYIY